MKICYIIENFDLNGGGERILADVSSQLASENNVSILSLTKNTGESLFKLDPSIKLQYSKIKKSKFGLINKFKYYNYLVVNSDFFSSFDVIIGVGLVPNILLSLLRINKYRIGWEHNSYKGVSLLFKILRRAVYKNLNEVIILTEYDRINYSRLNKNVTVIPNFTNFTCNQLKNIYNEEFLFIGRIEKVKGWDYLLKIILSFTKINNQWRFRVIGKGKYEKIFTKKIEQYGLSNRVSIKKESSMVISELSNTGCLLLTSRNEGLPMVLLEASICKVPIISFDCQTGPSEIIKNGVNGFLVEKGNIRDFVNKMLIFIENRDEIVKSTIDYKDNESKYSKAVIMNKWRVLLHNVSRKIDF